MLALNYVYELSFIEMCTSIVFLNKYGKINLASNFDFDFPEALYELSYLGQFYKDGLLIVEGTYVFGLVGLLRLSVPNKFAIAPNSRDSSQTLNDFL